MPDAADPRDGHPSRGPGRARLPASIGGGLADADIPLDDLLESTTDAVILVDNGDRICFWNRGAERMFQFAREEVVGRKPGFIVPADLRGNGEPDRLGTRIVETGSVHDHVTRRIRRDGEELWVSLSRTRLHDRAGAVIGSMATIRDITGQRRTEDELSRARGLAMIGELAARVAHEIKNPLAGIYAAIQLLGRDVEDGDPRKRIFEDIGHEVRRLDETMHELLRFARPVPPAPVPSDVRAFLVRVADQVGQHPDLRGHEVRVDGPHGLVAAFDGRLMGQVIENLVLNAAQAMDRPGRISVSASARGRRVRIEVRDSGPGIPPERLEAVFDPFFTTKARGTGLGLSVARKNVEAHGGTITARNGRTGGARFLISLPYRRSTGT